MGSRKTYWVFDCQFGKGWISERTGKFGKWIVRDENSGNLKKHKGKLNELVEKNKLTQIKFYNVKRMNEEGISLLPERDASVLMFYCYKNEKGEVKEIIEDLGLSAGEWKSNKQTAKDWQPGGKLFEEMKKALL